MEFQHPSFVILLVIIAAVVLLVMNLMKDESEGGVKAVKPVIEYQVSEHMYQLKDGSYVRLSFSIVVDEDQRDQLKLALEKEFPARLPDGINMMLGNKTRESIIDGTYKRDAFARELKQMIEEHVLAPHNKAQSNPENVIEVRDVLISVLVTQSG